MPWPRRVASRYAHKRHVAQLRERPGRCLLVDRDAAATGVLDPRVADADAPTELLLHIACSGGVKPLEQYS